jgi:hypothetical protein
LLKLTSGSLGSEEHFGITSGSFGRRKSLPDT